MKPYSVPIQMKAAEQYFPVVLFTVLCKENLPFESVKRHPKMCSRTLPPTKEKRREGTPSLRFFFPSLRLHVGYKVCYTSESANEKGWKRRLLQPLVERRALLGLNADMDVIGLPHGLFASEHIFRATNLNLTLQ